MCSTLWAGVNPTAGMRTLYVHFAATVTGKTISVPISADTLRIAHGFLTNVKPIVLTISTQITPSTSNDKPA
jgi:hypothetical protein